MIATVACLRASVDSSSADSPGGFGGDFSDDLNNSLVESDSVSAQVILPMPGPTITYALEDVPGFISAVVFESEVRSALDEWEWATKGQRLFVEAPVEEAHIIIGFRSPGHQEACDAGFSETAIAHAFTYDKECMAGTIHLNDGFSWVMNGSNRAGTYDVRYAILHEVGHMLGLSHVMEPGHIMYWEYVGVVRTLTEDESEDVLAIIEGM